MALTPPGTTTRNGSPVRTGPTPPSARCRRAISTTFRTKRTKDAFSGQSLSRDELDERLAPFRRQRGLVGDFEAPLGLFLQSAPPRDVIARLLRNLKEIHRRGEDWMRLAAVQDRLVVLLPQAWEERRDRALARAALGMHTAAGEDLALYLEHRPHAEDALEMRRRLAEWRRRPPLH